MLPGRGDVVAGRKFLDHLYIRGKAGPRKNSLEQIVTKDNAFGKPAVERRLERVHVVNALAAIGTFAKEILIDVGHGESVRIESAGAGENPLKQRTFTGARQRWRHSRLQHRVPLNHPSARRVKPRTIQRMR